MNCAMCPAWMGSGMVLGTVIGVLLVILLVVVIVNSPNHPGFVGERL